MFEARWSGFGFNFAGLSISGDKRRYTIDWGDGSSEAIRTDTDDDGDPFTTSSPAHGYAADGQYLVSVKQIGSGLPAERLGAYMYSTATADLAISGTRLSDVITGGSGNDTLKGRDGADSIAGADGNDRLSGGSGDDFVLGGAGSDFVSGDEGNDLVGGSDGDDRVEGGGGTDFVYGDDGADTLNGGDGDDFLDGGAGVDRLTGGAGTDTFTFSAPFVDGAPATSDRDRDLIVDFEQGIDRINVRSWFGGDFTFIGGASFSGNGSGELRYASRGSETLVLGDIDGNGTVDFGLRIAGDVVLQPSDLGL